MSKRPSIKNLTEEQMDLLVGSLLGDGAICCVNNGTSANWAIGHSDKQLDYLLFTKKLLEDSGLPVTTPSVTYKGKYTMYQIYVCLGKFGVELKHEFYPNRKKTITRSMLNYLSPKGLAIWYQDDGSRRFIKRNGIIQGREIKIATNCFSEEEHIIMQNYFRTAWDINWRINRDKQYYTLVTAATNANKFINIIKPFVHESLLYKIDLMYKRQSSQVASENSDGGIV